ncbi:putative ATPase [Nocardia sp. GAS34]|uniref:BTAD domain-containing putative transcriptional regulator n=1 Tax=unclassified Nocardia TaxID=2637762 RepID=UPI003D24B7E5
MQVRLLGTVGLVPDDGSFVPVGGPLVRKLLALLAWEPGRTIGYDRLADSIWGDQPPANTANALQTLVKRLRPTLAPEYRIEAVGPGYRLVADPDHIDAHRFTRLAAEGTSLLSGGQLSSAATALDAALMLWQGPALADVPRDPVLDFRVTQLNEQRLAAIEARADAYLALGRGTELVDALVAESSANPSRETLAARLIEASAAAQRQTAPTLPVRLTSFVGRDADVDRVVELLSEARLLTLTGPGGSGKTSLAIAAATVACSRQDGGCHLIELASIADPGTVGDHILSELGIPMNRDAERWDPLRRLVIGIADRRLLLILGNCEHLRSVPELVIGMLQSCPRVTVLVTSREPLGAAGELLYSVPPLELPPPRAGRADALRAPAVQLFLDRARAVRADFTLTDENCAAVCAICHRLDGIPLALELAAARIRVLAVGAILERLDDRFSLLTGFRASVPRHRTLHAVVAWSWELLSDAERTLIQQLCVFAGGVTLDSAQQVCVDDVTDLLIALVDKSLIEFDGRRYRMLETIRAFAYESLAAPDRIAFQRRHADHYLHLVELAEPALRTPAQRSWVPKLAIEHDNIVFALGWAVAAHDVDRALRLCGNMIWYWILCGYRAEALIWQRRVLDLVGDEPPVGLAAVYLACSYADRLPEYFELISLGMVRDDTERYCALVTRARGEKRQPHPVFVMLPALRELRRGCPQEIESCIDSGDPWLANNSLTRRGLERLVTGQPAAGAADLEAAAVRSRATGETRALCRILLTLATYRAGAYGAAAIRPLLDEAAGLVSSWVGANEVVAVHTWIGQLRAWTGDVTEARTHVTEALGRIDSTVRAGTVCWLRVVEADIARHTGDREAALSLYRQAINELTALRLAGQPYSHTANGAEVWGRAGYAITLAEAGEYTTAGAESATARALLDGPGYLEQHAHLGTAHAAIALASGHPRLALTIIGGCDTLHTGQPNQYRVPDAQRIVDAARATLSSDSVHRAITAGHDLTPARFAILQGCAEHPDPADDPRSRIAS